MRTQSTLAERVLQFSMPSVSSANLEKAVEAFRDFVKCKYPESQCVSDNVWLYSMKKAEDGGPAISNRTVRPEYVFWEQKFSASHNPVWRIKVSSELITLNFRKNTPPDCGTWEDVVMLYNELIVYLAQKLNVTQWKSVTAMYFFAYSAKTIPDKSIIHKDWIDVKRLLQPFANMTHADSFTKFLPKYYWNQSWRCVKDGREYTVNSQLEAETFSGPKEENSLEIRLFLTVGPNEVQPCKSVDWTSVFTLLKENYEALLTQHSKAMLMEDFK